MASAQLKNSFTSIGEIESSVQPSTLTLKISVSDTSLRYAVLSNAHQQILFFGQYTLHHVADNKELSQRMAKIFGKDEILQLPFAQALIGVDTPYSLLPMELTFMKNANQQLQWCTRAAVNLAFTIDEDLKNTLQELFPEATFVHVGSSLLETYPLCLPQTADKLFVNVSQHYFDVVRFKDDNSLLMMNRYKFKTETDFIYFLLLCCEELGINRETTTLVLSGEVDKNSKVFDICYRYFKNIEFAEVPESITFSKHFGKHAPHLHFNLYTLAA